LQPIPRRLFRYGVARNSQLRRWVVRAQRLPIPALTAQLIRPAVKWYVRTVEADGRRATEAGVRADLAALPALLDHVDRLLGDGTLTLDPPNAAALQIMASVNLMGRLPTSPSWWPHTHAPNRRASCSPATASSSRHSWTPTGWSRCESR
jgi:hypothetical protein